MPASPVAMRTLRIALGLIWIADAALQCQPVMFSRAFVTDIVVPNATGQPGFVAAPIHLIARLIEPRVALFNAFAIAIQLLIGLGLMRRSTVKPALLVSFGWALAVWWFGEGLGGLLSGTAAPLTGAPGPVLLYVLAGLILWPRAGAPTGRPAPTGLGAQRAARWAWAVLWLGSAALWLLPANRAVGAVHDQIAGAPAGAGWLSSLEATLATAAAGHGPTIAIIAAGLSVFIGLAVLLDRAARPALALAVIVALVYFVAGQGVGGILSGSGTDPGSGPLLILLAAALWVGAPGAPSGDAPAPRTARRRRQATRRLTTETVVG